MSANVSRRSKLTSSYSSCLHSELWRRCHWNKLSKWEVINKLPLSQNRLMFHENILRIKKKMWMCSFNMDSTSAHVALLLTVCFLFSWVPLICGAPVKCSLPTRFCFGWTRSLLWYGNNLSLQHISNHRGEINDTLNDACVNYWRFSFDMCYFQLLL